MLKFNLKLIPIIFLFTILGNAGSIVPTSEFYPGWSQSDQVRTFYKNDLYGHINGGAELFLEYGFDSLQVAYYKNGDEELALEIYKMERPRSALGIYLMKCGKESSSQKLRCRNTFNRFQLLFVKGNYFIQINNFSGNPLNKEAVLHLAQQISSSILENDLINPFVLLPSENILPESKILVRGIYGMQKIYTFGPDDILGLNGHFFAEIADYRAANDTYFTRIFIDYREVDLAKNRFRELKSNLDPLLKIKAEQDQVFIFQDYNQKYGIVRFNGTQLQIQIHLLTEPKI